MMAMTLSAAPTLDGATGLIIMPTAESLKYKEFNLASDWMTRLVSGNNSVVWKYKANIGAFSGLELGFVGQNDREGVFINMKYYLISDNTKYPLKMAIGLDNLTSYSQTDAYMVASKRFNALWAGHFGFKVDLANGQANASLMLGSDYVLSENLSWLADLNGEGSKYLINTGLRYSFHPNAMLSLSAVNICGEKTTDYPGTMFTFGLTWTDYL
jgi:hypothetical protein